MGINQSSGRVLKFRAWNGKFMLDAAYGDWICFDGVPYTEATQSGKTRNIEIEKAKDYVLMQFTGLLDKNGKEIFEGDIVQYGRRRVEVYFESGCFYGGLATLVSVNDLCEVKGNIYSNPELLTDGD